MVGHAYHICLKRIKLCTKLWNYLYFSAMNGKQKGSEEMKEAYEKLQLCYERVRKKIECKPEVALVLGSGLGDYADSIKVEAELSYGDIEGFPVSTVPGHDGKFIFGYVGEVPVVCMKGRVHYYEGYPISDVVLPVRLMRQMGAEILFLTNASGGVNPDFQAGDLMMLTDHIACFVPNPLMGANADALGVRFPDMSEIYDRSLQAVIRNCAVQEGIQLREGVYLQLTGPSYESPAEVRMLHTLGADAVGMSTAVEAVAANHMGMKICGISCVCNLAAGLSPQPLSHQEVQEAAAKASPLFKKLVTASILKFGQR